MSKLTVGQKVWVLYSGHRRSEETFNECLITNVGRKYFHIDWPLFRNAAFSVQTLRHEGGEYMSMGKVYLSEQEYFEEQRMNKIIREVNETFSRSGSNRQLTYLQYEQIHKIIFEP